MARVFCIMFCGLHCSMDFPFACLSELVCKRLELACLRHSLFRCARAVRMCVHDCTQGLEDDVLVLLRVVCVCIVVVVVASKFERSRYL